MTANTTLPKDYQISRRVYFAECALNGLLNKAHTPTISEEVLVAIQKKLTTHALRLADAWIKELDKNDQEKA